MTLLNSAVFYQFQHFFIFFPAPLLTKKQEKL